MYFGTSPSLPPRPGSGCCVKQAIAQDRDRCQTERQEAEEKEGNFCEKSLSSVLLCGRGAGRGNWQVEGHLQSLNLGEGLNVGHEGGIGSDDRPDTAWLSRRLHSAIVQAAHTSTSSTHNCASSTHKQLYGCTSYTRRARIGCIDLLTPGAPPMACQD